jgi:hypothetical protein
VRSTPKKHQAQKAWFDRSHGVVMVKTAYQYQRGRTGDRDQTPQLRSSFDCGSCQSSEARPRPFDG